jgi:hypothetical protein
MMTLKLYFYQVLGAQLERWLAALNLNELTSSSVDMEIFIVIFLGSTLQSNYIGEFDIKYKGIYL